MSKNTKKTRFRPKYHIKKGDTVVVISGADKSVEGRVLRVLTKKGTAIVEGVRVVKKHTKPNNQYPKGGVIEQEAPIQISNLMLIDPKTGEATRVGRRRTEDGRSVRYSKKTGEVID